MCFTLFSFNSSFISLHFPDKASMPLSNSQENFLLQNGQLSVYISGISGSLGLGAGDSVSSFIFASIFSKHSRG